MTTFKDISEMPARDILSFIYLDWMNNYLTTERYAECNGLTDTQACTLINLARDVARSEHPEA